MHETTYAQSPTRKALEGIRVIDLTHVQAGPACTQLMAWMGADVIKVEPPDQGDITRSQLRDVPEADSLYFTMLNSNKRSVAIDLKSSEGKQDFTNLLRCADVLVENYAPGALDRLGFTWERVHSINQRLVYASLKGFGPGRFANAKAYEPVAQAVAGSMSTTGFEDGPPLVTGAQIGDTGTAIHLYGAILTALYQRTRTDKGQRVEVAMRDGILNLCRVKLRDQQRLKHGPLAEYPNRQFGDVVPRSGNASGGGQPGWALRCKPGGMNDYLYAIIQPQGWQALMSKVGRDELIQHPDYATPEARLPRLKEIFELIEQWTLTKTKWEAFQELSEIDVPCGPVLSTQELLEDPDLRAAGMIVELAHPERGQYVTVGCPFQLSDSPVEVTRAPLLGEHTAEILEQVRALNACDYSYRVKEDA